MTYERVTKTQFSSTADLKAYMTASLTQKMIDSRYAAILGTDKPLYIDANGGLYGRQYATSGGFTWIDPEQVTISNAADSSFTASMQYDNFGAADTLTVQIVLCQRLSVKKSGSHIAHLAIYGNLVPSALIS